MTLPRQLTVSRWRAGVLLALVLCAPATRADAAALRARHAQVRQALQASPYGRPLVIESEQSASMLRGQVDALLPHPLPAHRPSLQTSLQGHRH